MDQTLTNFHETARSEGAKEVLGHTAFRISLPDEERAGSIRHGLKLPNGFGVILDERLVKPDWDGSRDDEFRIQERNAGFFDLHIHCKSANNFHLQFDPSILCADQVLRETFSYLKSWTPDSPRFHIDRDSAVEAMVAPDLTGLFREGARRFENSFPQKPSFTEPPYLRVSDALVEQLELEIGQTLEFMPEQLPMIQRINHKVFAESLKRACNLLSGSDLSKYSHNLQIGLLMTERYLPRGYSARVFQNLGEVAAAA
jgi:hypothetical protein